MSSSGEVKLIDFGLAHVYSRRPDGTVDASLPLRDACGSMAFSAPEVRCSAGYDGLKADLWSLGVCLFVMITGALPFEHADDDDAQFAAFSRACAGGRRPCEAALAGLHRRQRPRISAELALVLDGLLALDPQERPSAAEILASGWIAGGRSSGR